MTGFVVQGHILHTELWLALSLPHSPIFNNSQASTFALQSVYGCLQNLRNVAFSEGEKILKMSYPWVKCNFYNVKFHIVWLMFEAKYILKLYQLAFIQTRTTQHIFCNTHQKIIKTCIFTCTCVFYVYYYIKERYNIHLELWVHHAEAAAEFRSAHQQLLHFLSVVKVVRLVC